MKKLLGIILSLVFITAASCTPEPQVLNVMTHDSFAVSESVIEAFESENNVKVNFLLSGDAGSMLNQAVLTKGNPSADVLYGVDNTFLSRALEESIFEAFESPQLAHIPAEFKLDGTFSALPVDYGDVCINYDRGYFEAKNLDLPKSLEDLANPVYEGMLVVENPATSSPGLAFLMATIVEYGEEDYLDYWQRLLDNGAVVVNDWETAYYSNFSGSSGKGPQPMVVSYGTSPAAEVFFAETDLDEAPTASLVGRNMCYRQIEFVGILAGAENRKIAEAFVDFMLNILFQEDIPLNMFVFPVNENAVLPDVFVEHIQTVEKPASLPMADIAANREQWIEDWREIILE